MVNNPTDSSDTSIQEQVRQEKWYQERLVVVVLGASGDLAKKETYPALLHLFAQNLLPPDHNTAIWGFARTDQTNEEFRDHLAPKLKQELDGDESRNNNDESVHAFLSKCYYHHGSSYDDFSAYEEMMNLILQQHHDAVDSSDKTPINFLFYFAIPPNVFGDTATTLRQVLDATTHKADTPTNIGWTRLIVEKPFGRDLDSCKELLQLLSQHYDESQLYRMDHYLGKEMVQNLLVLRSCNAWINQLFHRDFVQAVYLTLKEPFGAEGRGGYFDQFGIVRDVMQNHLLQVLTLIAMDVPDKKDDDGIRNAKVQVLQNMPLIELDDVLVGQYEGYTDDESIDNKETRCPTYAAFRCYVDTDRWRGVPFVMEAGKALDEHLCQVRLQLKSPLQHACKTGNNKQEPEVFAGNELVLCIQPDPNMCLTTHIKTPGFGHQPTSTKLSLNYGDLPTSSESPAAYTRLVLEVLRGHAEHFVRHDELLRSWEIFTPLLQQLEHDDGRSDDDSLKDLWSYPYGSNGPAPRMEFLRNMMKMSHDDDKQEEDKQEAAPHQSAENNSTSHVIHHSAL